MEDNFIKVIQKSFGLDLSTAIELAAQFKPKSYPPGTMLTYPGAVTTQAAYLQSGLVKFYLKGKVDEEIIMNFRYAPIFITYSLVGFFMNWPSHIYCETITAVDCLVIDSREIMNLADDHPSIYNFLLPQIAGVYHRRQSKEIRAMESTSKDRYLEFLEEYATQVDHIPQKDVAAYLNIRPGSLSRIRKEVRN